MSERSASASESVAAARGGGGSLICQSAPKRRAACVAVCPSSEFLSGCSKVEEEDPVMKMKETKTESKCSLV